MVKRFKHRFYIRFWLIWICKAKNADLDKYKHSGYSIGFDPCSEFLFTNESFEKKVISGADMSWSADIDNRNKDILILGDRPTQGLDDTTLTVEDKYPITFTQSERRFVISLHYNGSNSLFG